MIIAPPELFPKISQALTSLWSSPAFEIMV